MSVKKFITAIVLGFLGGGIVYFLLEEVLFKQLIVAGFINKLGMTTIEPSSLGALGALVGVVVMAYIYPKGYEGGAPAIEGAKFGALLGLYLTAPWMIGLASFLSLTAGFTLFYILVGIIEQTCTGIIIGLVYGKISRK